MCLPDFSGPGRKAEVTRMGDNAPIAFVSGERKVCQLVVNGLMNKAIRNAPDGGAVAMLNLPVQTTPAN